MTSAVPSAAWLKLDLYCRGIRIHPSCHVEQAGGRPLLRTRAGLGSGLELILPGNHWTNVPVLEAFARQSPYELVAKESRFEIHREGTFVTQVQLAPRPAWYDSRTSSGKRMDRVGTLQGTYLGIYPAAVCEYWKETPRTNCRFCSVGLNLGHDDAETKTVEDVLEVVHAARQGSGITYVDFNTGHYEGETYLDILEPMIRRIKSETDLFVGVQTPPHHDLSRYDRLQEMGVNRVSFCFELFDHDKFVEVCPGKDRQYGLDRYLNTVEYCARLGKNATWMRPWVANGEIIAGLEPPESSIRAIDWLTERGAIPTVCVFRPLRGTDMEDSPPPATEDLVPVFARLYEACMEHNLPIGLAPNIHVSLVMLPEECAELARDPRRYAFKERKRRAAAKLYSSQFFLRRKLSRLRPTDARVPA
jgi:hypothetical protein